MKFNIIILISTLFFLLFILYFLNYKEGFSTWDNIGVIYYINLDDREDRKHLFLEEMDKVDLPSNKIERISAIYEKDRGAFGCSKSHIKALESFINSGHDNCIIFEDDFVFTESKEVVLQSLDNVFKKGLDFDVIMLSANIIVSEPSEYPSLAKAINVQTASGYMVSKKYVNTLKENFTEGASLLEKSFSGRQYLGQYAVDQYWKQLQPISNWYIFEPKLGKQRQSYSNIEDAIVDYNV